MSRVFMKEINLQCFQDIFTAVKMLQPHEDLRFTMPLLSANWSMLTLERDLFQQPEGLKPGSDPTCYEHDLTIFQILNTHKKRLDRLCLGSVANSAQRVGRPCPRPCRTLPTFLLIATMIYSYSIFLHSQINIIIVWPLPKLLKYIIKRD